MTIPESPDSFHLANCSHTIVSEPCLHSCSENTRHYSIQRQTIIYHRCIGSYNFVRRYRREGCCHNSVKTLVDQSSRISRHDASPETNFTHNIYVGAMSPVYGFLYTKRREDDTILIFNTKNYKTSETQYVGATNIVL